MRCSRWPSAVPEVRRLAAYLMAVLAVVLPASTPASEDDLALAEGQGRERVEALCSACHSLDYIPMNSPFLDRKGWEKTVDKMIRVMGAPIGPEDVAAIVDYLSTRYGK